jgi:hypothetical protein
MNRLQLQLAPLYTGLPSLPRLANDKVDLKRLAGMDPNAPPAGASVYRTGDDTTRAAGGKVGGSGGGGDAVRGVRRAQAASSGSDSLGRGGIKNNHRSDVESSNRVRMSV